MIYGILKDNYTYPLKDTDVISAFVTPLSIINNQPAYAQDSINLRRKASLQGVQRWELVANLAPTNDSAVNLINSVVNNIVNVFTVRMPQVYGLNISTTSAYAAFASRGQSNITTTTTSLVPGEFINFGILPKAYLVVASNGYSATIVPPLLSDVPEGTQLRRGGDCTLAVRYNSDLQSGIKYTDGVLSDQGSVHLLENI